MILEMCKKAKIASAQLAKSSNAMRTKALNSMADALEKNKNKIFQANQKDVDAAKAKGVRMALLDRLVVNERQIANMARCLREVAALPDPLSEITKTLVKPNGLIIGQVSVPLGVVGIIYESRPDVTSDASGICIKSGNAVILRGGSDAINSNESPH